MSPSSESKIAKRLRKWLLNESIIIVIASVMAYGLVEYSANLVVGNDFAGDPIFMIGMIGPMGIVMGLISFFSMRAAKRLMSRSICGNESKNEKSHSNWLVIETALIVIVSMMTFGLLDYGMYVRLGDSRAYNPVLSLGMIGSMGLIMGLISHFSLKAMNRRMALSISEIGRRSAAGPRSREIETSGEIVKTEIARRLGKRRLLESIVIVIASEMTFGLVEYIANVVLGQNRFYQPGNMIGMIVPMGLIMGLISYFSLRVDTRYTSLLLSAIENVADGKFDIRLREDDAGPFREVFANFNRMCEELQGVQTLRDDFINHFSHEFKTPITSINGFAKLLLEEERVSDEERAQYLKIIASESERLAELSGNALMITKLESQYYILDKAPYALDEQIRQCVILLSPQWTKKRIDLSADLDPATYTGNADLMQHVWINLLGNAIKFTPDHGEVSLSLKRRDKTFVVTVSDTGKGMTTEELAHALEKYYQGGSSSASKGLGLGLAIVKRIVELSGGRIEVSSSLGEGSTFTAYLPESARVI
jgi:signal transduction histidine kinase